MTASEFQAILKKPKLSKEKFVLEQSIGEVCCHMGYTDFPEHKFHPTRKWRFDWAIPDLKIAIEYEGLHSAKSRHTTITGFSNDCEKYNAAALLGWIVLRYTANTYKKASTDLIEAIELRKGG